MTIKKHLSHQLGSDIKMWNPSLLTINLSEEKILPKKPIESKIIENFLGGRGIAVYLAYHTIPTDTSPRGPENSIIFSTGALTGTQFPSSGMIAATFKSPQTNTLFTSIATGNMGAYFKQSRIDFFQLFGKAKTPIYILIDEFKDIIIKNAEDIWTLSIDDTDKLLRERYGNDICTAAIGPAAINQVSYAGLAVNKKHFFQRGGLGAVLASKNLKAIILCEKPTINELQNIQINLIDDLKRNVVQSTWYNMLNQQGTFSLILSAFKNNVLPTKNCTRVLKLPLERITSFQGYGTNFDCWQCFIQCKKNSYQDFVSLGLNLKVDNLEDIQKAIQLCDNEAIDPLSTGAALASLFNIQEDRRKLLDINLGYTWNNPQIYSLIETIIKRKGLGDQLARGETYLYQQTSEPSPMIKNQMSTTFYYPNILGLSLAVSIAPYSGGDFHSNYIIFPELLAIPFKLPPMSKHGKVETVIFLENFEAVLDSLIICSRFIPFFLEKSNFLSLFPSSIVSLLYRLFPHFLITKRIGIQAKWILQLVNTIYDRKMTFRELLSIGNRITLLERIFNTRTGMNRDDDLFEPYLNKRPDFYENHGKLLSKYYDLKGLNSRGLIQKQTLEKTGLLGLVTI